MVNSVPVIMGSRGPAGSGEHGQKRCRTAHSILDNFGRKTSWYPRSLTLSQFLTQNLVISPLTEFEKFRPKTWWYPRWLNLRKFLTKTFWYPCSLNFRHFLTQKFGDIPRYITWRLPEIFCTRGGKFHRFGHNCQYHLDYSSNFECVL